MEKLVCESLRHIYELESALYMAHGNKYSYPHKTKNLPKKYLKGLFLPRLRIKSEAEETHGVSRYVQGIPAPCWMRGELGEVGGCEAPAFLLPWLPSQPAHPPLQTPCCCTTRSTTCPTDSSLHARLVSLLAVGSCALCKPSSACGCCEGTPTRT